LYVETTENNTIAEYITKVWKNTLIFYYALLYV
jgi:hypothetical protein